jgi:Fe-S-cluster containining protein
LKILIKVVVIFYNMLEGFSCKRCGECCKGSPRLSQEDIERIMELGVKPEQFVEIINNVSYMRIWQDQCVFLDWKADGKAFCRIYDSRPRICRLYPGSKLENCQPEKWFFDEYLEKRNRERFENAKK